jgi:hypothetical protein
MGLLDDLLNRAGDVLQPGKDAVEQIGGELGDVTGELGIQAEEIVGAIDVPGELDENIKDILGLGEK